VPADRAGSGDGDVREVAVAIIGGGQAGLAVGFYLRRAGLVPGEDFVILDAADQPGGAWPQMWDGLRLFSPSTYSSLPGWMMPPWDDASHGFPSRDHVVDYLTRYEQRYELAVERPRRVLAVERSTLDPHEREPLLVRTSIGDLTAGVVVSATGTWTQPFWPAYPGAQGFAGRQLHASQYRRPEDFAGQRVVVVGGGNSAAQILAEVSTVAETTWVTTRPPRFLPDDVDGRVLFTTATRRVQAQLEGGDHPGVGGLGDIVMVPSVRDARERGVLKALPMFGRLDATGIVWADGTRHDADAVIWCTGFRPALRHLSPLHLNTENGHPRTDGPTDTQATGEPRLHLVGYGDWTGAASATLIGAGRTARDTARVVVQQLDYEQAEAIND
jgi:putative flavoprotein involved in K+ transport